MLSSAGVYVICFCVCSGLGFHESLKVHGVDYVVILDLSHRLAFPLELMRESWYENKTRKEEETVFCSRSKFLRTETLTTQATHRPPCRALASMSIGNLPAVNIRKVTRSLSTIKFGRAF